MKLDCVFYYVTDLDRAVEFYAHALGLTLVSRDVVARFRVDGLLFELVPTDEPSRCSGAGNARVTFMIVRPEYQRAGLGSRVLSMLLARCREANIRDVQLFCARGKKAFYLRHGFEPRPDDAPGMQLR